MTERAILYFELWMQSGSFLSRSIKSKEVNTEWFKSLRQWHPGMFIMTPQEELHAKFFNEGKVMVKDMSLLEVRAWREEIALIAFEARAKHAAADEHERELLAKEKKNKGITGVDTDSVDITSNAINKIRERGKKLSKQEKLIQTLMQLPGFDRAAAEKAVSARNIKENAPSLKKDNFKPGVSFNPFAANKIEVKPEDDTCMQSPNGEHNFEDKSTEKKQIIKCSHCGLVTKEMDRVTEVTILPETDTIIIKETITEVFTDKSAPEAKKSFNPFAK